MKKTMPFLLPIIRNIVIVAVMVIFIKATKSTFLEASKWWSLICIIANVVTICIMYFILRYEGKSYKDIINYSKGQLRAKYVAILTIAMFAIGVGGMYFFGFVIYGAIPTLTIQPTAIWLSVVNILLLPVTIIFAELPLYYGYSYSGIVKVTKNKIFAVSYIIFFYALQHIFLPFMPEFKHILFKFLSFIPLMVFIAIIYNRKKTLDALMVGHGIMDLATALQIFIMSLFPAIYQMM